MAETPPVLDGTIALFFLFAGFAMMYYCGYISAVVDVLFRPNSHSQSRPLLALPAQSGPVSGSQLAPVLRSHRFPIATSLAALPPAVEKRFLAQDPPFHPSYGPTTLEVYSPYKPLAIPPATSNVPNYYLFQTMAAAPLLYLSHPASTASVSSSLISERAEEGCLALLITLTSILFITLLIWAFNRCSGKKEKIGLRMVKDDIGLYHIGRRDLSNMDEGYSYFNGCSGGCSGLSSSHVLMSSLPMKSCFTSEVVPANILKLHIAHNEIQYVHKEYNARKRKMALKRLVESQELMCDAIVAMSRRGKLEKNRLAFQIQVELNNYCIRPSSLRIEGQSGMIITTWERYPSQYHITEMDERSLTTILDRKVESLRFTIEELLNYFQSDRGWTVAPNGRNRLSIDIRVHRFDQMVSLEMRAIGYDSQTRNEKRLIISAPIIYNHYTVPTISFFARASVRNLGMNLSLYRIGMMVDIKPASTLCSPNYIVPAFSYMAKKNSCTRNHLEIASVQSISTKPTVWILAKPLKLTRPSFSDLNYMTPKLFAKEILRNCTNNHEEITSYLMLDGILKGAIEKPSASISQSCQHWKADLDKGHDEEQQPINVRVGKFPDWLNTNTILSGAKSAQVLEVEAVGCSHGVKANKSTSPILCAHYMIPTISSQAKVRASPSKPTVPKVRRPLRKSLSRSDARLICPKFSCPKYMASTVSAMAKVRTCTVEIFLCKAKTGPALSV